MPVKTLKITFRGILRNKTASLINIGGLAFAMSVCILIGLWIIRELNYDKVHENFETIAKVRQNIKVNNNIVTDKVVPLPLADELRSVYKPYFKHIIRSSHRMTHVLSFEGKAFNQQGVFMEPEAPIMFSLTMIKGSLYGLKDPNSILLTASAAEAFFGSEDPMDKILFIDNNIEVKVTGIYEDLPSNSTFANVKFISPFSLYLAHEKWLTPIMHNWDKSPVQTYVQIARNQNMEKVSRLIKHLVAQKNNSNPKKDYPEIFLEPMNKWHLYADYKNGMINGGKIRYVRMFAIIGFFILILACINFMNLTTARSRKKALEVGIRKTIGSHRYQLIAKFYLESFIIVLLALAFAILIVVSFLPVFNTAMATNLAVPWTSVLFWFFCFIVVLTTGFLAGSYPALYLSSFKPIKVLKGEFKAGKSSTIPRKVLVVFQFSICICLLFATIMISRQIQFGKNRPIGYDPDKLLQVYLPAKDISQHFNAFQNELYNTQKVESVAMSESTVTDVWGTDNALEWKNKDPELVVDFPNTGVSVEYGKTMRWQFLDGRDFSKNYASDSAGFILNEAAVRFMGLNNPVGEIIRWHGKPFTVIGVIKDIVVESPFLPVRPSIYCMARGYDNFLFIRIKETADNVTTVNEIAKVFKKFTSSQPFDFRFVEDEYNKKFFDESQINKLSKLFSGLAILISALGLFGLTTFIAEQRSKEIGLRKVLGASIFNLWVLLTSEFVLLVLLSCFVAAPVAWLYVNSWLRQFEYRTTIEWPIFILVGFGCLLVTILTVSFKAIKAASMNPVNTLKSE
ncbi:ABC transporter permease [Flavitalea sp.]|nr:FtsX-like permease family protein [Flavitalea sp.]